jgi:beta-galactosidase
MLGGQGIPNKLPDEVRNIPVNRKADALFFLHTARLDARRNDQEIKQKKQYEMCRYVVS